MTSKGICVASSKVFEGVICSTKDCYIKLFLDSHDPGWNDPPIFTYDKATAIQAAAATKKGASLNKRVAFPMSGVAKDSNKSGIINDPTRPPSAGEVPPPPTSVTAGNKQQTPPQPEIKVITKDRLEEVLKNFEYDTVCDDEIAKRIKIMEKMWIEDKLDENVRLRIFELSEALAKKDFDTVDHIQKGLMVDKISQCSTWMSGIRHLINRKKENLDNK